MADLDGVPSANALAAPILRQQKIAMTQLTLEMPESVFAVLHQRLVNSLRKFAMRIEAVVSGGIAKVRQSGLWLSDDMAGIPQDQAGESG